MDKSSLLNNKILDKSNIALICILGMGFGFLFSSAMLSSFTFLFGINAIRDVSPRLWIRNKWWLAALGWVLLYALTWFWSEDKGQWGVRLQIKLPFLLLPLAVAYIPSFTPKQLKLITLSLGAALVVSACYSLSFLLRDPEAYKHGYVMAHLLPTLPDDHVRTSMSMVLFVIWGVYVWPSLEGSGVRWLVGGIMAFLIVFVHILAAKSGLISFYLFLGAWGLYAAFTKRKIIGILVLIAIPVLFKLGMYFIPTFESRVAYTLYGYEMFMTGDKSGNYGDANRLMSYNVAMKLIKEHPMGGVGTGDMYHKMTDGYHQLYPEVPQAAILLPHNQFLVVGLGCGIPAMVLFTLWVFMPLARIRRNRESFFFFMVWLLLLMQLMIEPVLEIQYGVWVYLFFLVMFMHRLPGVATGFTQRREGA